MPEVLPTDLDRAKLDLTRKLLRLRRDDPDLFLSGDYRPLAASGRVCAFMRSHAGRALKVAVSLGGESSALDDVVPVAERTWPPDAHHAAAPVRIALVGAEG
jgi:maltooligosyltrehalose synthase